MAFIERFSQVVKGDLIFIGNTLGLSKGENQNIAGKIGSIGAFTSTDENNVVATFPKGTSLEHLKNSSSAIFNLPKDSQILYAELVWSGIYKTNNKDISKDLTKPISLTTPKGKYDISAEYRTKQDNIIKLNNLSLGVYVRTANVTNIVKQSLYGTYTVGKIPAILEPIDNETSKTNFAGWTLIVAYKNDKLSPKKLNINVGYEAVYKDKSNIDVTIAGFELPKNNLKNAKLLISSGEGDAEISGDSVYIGKNSTELTKISGINNPEDNFFGSQINDMNGELNTLGTFGKRNHDVKNKTNIDAGRQGWDIACVDIKKNIKSNYDKTLVRFTSTGDLFIPNAIGLSIDNLGANLNVKKSCDKSTFVWGDLITYSIEIENIGDTLAEDIVLLDSLPKSLTFLEHSINIDGKSYSGTFPIPLSNLNPNEKHIITFKMRVDSKNCKITKNTANVKYSYVLSSGEKIKETSNSNISCIKPDGQLEKIKLTKFVDKSIANRGDILTYTNTMENISDITVKNILFHDEIPNETTFINGSVMINNVNFENYNPETGFVINELLAKQTLTVIFKVKIK